MSRIVVLVGVLLVMLLVPLYLSKERADKVKARALDGAERAVDARAAQAALAASASRRRDPDRLGLTFGWRPAASANEVWASCRGLPALVADGVMRDCNASAGDTPCRTELPLLCLREAEGEEPRALATAHAVAGFLIEGGADADRRCAKELGPRWRMATYEDSERLDLRAARALGTAADTRTRAWVATRSPGAQCWDPV